MNHLTDLLRCNAPALVLTLAWAAVCGLSLLAAGGKPKN